ncbi:MAG: hypothetical protein ACYS1C_13060, partial [Planctomycetota bacterium]
MREPDHGGERKCLALVSVPDERAYRCFARLAEELAQAGVRLCTVEMDSAAPPEPTEEGPWLRLPFSRLWEAWETAFPRFLAPEGREGPLAALTEEEVLGVARMFGSQAADALGVDAECSPMVSGEWWWLRIWTVLLHAFRPDVVLVWNGGSTWSAALAAVGRFLGSAVLYGERGPLPDTLQVDPEGVNGLSAFARSSSDAELPALSADAEAELDAYVASVRRSGSSAWGQPDRESAAALRQRLQIPAEAKVLFFPGQVTIDTNVLLNSPHFEGNAEVVQFLTVLLAERPH